MASHPIYQFYAELDEFNPRIWRRFQVNSGITVARFCYIIQVLFEMTASHLMSLEASSDENWLNFMRIKQPDISESILREMGLIGEKESVLRYEIKNEDYVIIPDPYRDVQIVDAAAVKLRNAVYTVGNKMNFYYDFGDNWCVSLKLEKIIVDKELPGSELPRVLEGANFGIIEDCGGTGGLEKLAKAFKNKKGDDYERFSKWLGIEDFDINAFDLDDMNFRLKKIPRIYKQCYEDRLIPTQRSYDLIERRYLKDKS